MENVKVENVNVTMVMKEMIALNTSTKNAQMIAQTKENVTLKQENVNVILVLQE